MPDSKDKTEEEEIDIESMPDFRDFRWVYCRGCGTEMRHTPLVICSECLGDEVDRFYKAAVDEEDDELVEGE
jgi:hypothetical protein